MKPFRHAQDLGKKLGPGLITGAADDDPSGIATYSQAGAQFGGGLFWTMAFTTPLMIGVQMISARIGWVTGRGLAAAMFRVLPRWLAIAIVAALVFANTLNIGADIAAMGEALQLIVGGPEHGHALVFGLLCAVLPVWFSYEQMVRVLKYLTLSLLAYVAVVFALHVRWDKVFVDTLIPKFTHVDGYWMMVVAVLGTTISPYLFFWQAAQESELRQRLPANVGSEMHALSPAFMREHLQRIRLDTIVGMVLSNTIGFCIMLATAVTLNQAGITDIQTARQAAEALRPIAGDFAFYVFAAGVIGTGMLAVPVLAGSAAYAVAEAFEWRAGLDQRLTEARGFYSVLVIATMVGTLLDFTSLDPIRALVWSAIANGVIAAPIMVVLVMLGRNPKVLGDAVLSKRHQVLGGFAALVMTGAVAAMVWDFFAH